jgi:hypothetical protein
MNWGQRWRKEVEDAGRRKTTGRAVGARSTHVHALLDEGLGDLGKLLDALGHCGGGGGGVVDA